MEATKASGTKAPPGPLDGWLGVLAERLLPKLRKGAPSSGSACRIGTSRPQALFPERFSGRIAGLSTAAWGEGV